MADIEQPVGLEPDKEGVDNLVLDEQLYKDQLRDMVESSSIDGIVDAVNQKLNLANDRLEKLIDVDIGLDDGGKYGMREEKADAKVAAGLQKELNGLLKRFAEDENYEKETFMSEIDNATSDNRLSEIAKNNEELMAVRAFGGTKIESAGIDYRTKEGS